MSGEEGKVTQSALDIEERLPVDAGEGKVLVRRYLEEIAPNGEIARLDVVFAADLVAHLGGRSATGIQLMRDYVATFHSAFPDVTYVIEDEVSEGDRVVARWRWEGTHLGAFQGIAPTGRRVSQTGTTVFRISAGKIAEVWPQADFMGLMQQLGASLRLPGDGA